MGILTAKCPKCWDAIPCGCGDTDKDREIRQTRASYAATTAIDETNRLMREQNELLREQNELLRRSKDGGNDNG